MLEKEGLSIQKGPNGEIDELRFDPKHFSPKALAAIILHQVNTASPNDIIISGPEKSFVIGWKDFQTFRYLDADQKIKTVCGAVEDMKRAEEVIIERSLLKDLPESKSSTNVSSINKIPREQIVFQMVMGWPKLTLNRAHLDRLRH